MLRQQPGLQGAVVPVVGGRLRRPWPGLSALIATGCLPRRPFRLTQQEEVCMLASVHTPACERVSVSPQGLCDTELESVPFRVLGPPAPPSFLPLPFCILPPVPSPGYIAVGPQGTCGPVGCCRFPGNQLCQRSARGQLGPCMLKAPFSAFGTGGRV